VIRTFVLLLNILATSALASSGQQALLDWAAHPGPRLLAAETPALPFAPGVTLGVTALGHDASGASLSGQALQLATGSIALAKIGPRSFSACVYLGLAQQVPGWGASPGGAVYGAGLALDLTAASALAVTLNAGALSLDGHWTGFAGLGLTWDWRPPDK
jgi:hypothetical protein